jgi:dTDP-4-dehydrorhamnose 3,5-epimerase-like enzyme
LIRGAQLLALKVHADARGELGAFEQRDNLPFDLKRVFYLRVDDPGVTRSGHANSCDELIVAVSGSVFVEVDNGEERSGVRLHTRDQGLWVRPGVLISLHAFEPQTVLLVCASSSFADTQRSDRVQPQWIAAACAG